MTNQSKMAMPWFFAGGYLLDAVVWRLAEGRLESIAIPAIGLVAVCLLAVISRRGAKQERVQARRAITRIGMALCACNHCVTTDIPGTETDETHWRIDHSQELEDLKYLEGVFQ